MAVVQHSGWTMRRAAYVGAFACAAAVALSFLATGPVRSGLLAGAVAGAIGGALGLVLVGRAAGKSTKDLLAALVLAFLGRVLLVGVGLVATLRGAGGDPLAFVATFFPLFFAFAVLELLVASAHLRRAPAA